MTRRIEHVWNASARILGVGVIAILHLTLLPLLGAESRVTMDLLPWTMIVTLPAFAMPAAFQNLQRCRGVSVLTIRVSEVLFLAGATAIPLTASRILVPSYASLALAAWIQCFWVATILVLFRSWISNSILLRVAILGVWVLLPIVTSGRFPWNVEQLAERGVAGLVTLPFALALVAATALNSPDAAVVRVRGRNS